MIDLENIELYTENNRIEAKKALGGLPHSIWETYSAFANTLGGIILLGVEEYRDKSFHTVSLPCAKSLLDEFLTLLNDYKKASANILSKEDATVEKINGSEIVVIRVPRAKREYRPVYIDGNPYLGSYKRGGEGDYRCSKQEVDSMLRDAELKTPDMNLLESLGIDALNPESVRGYRARLLENAPDSFFNSLCEIELLCNVGAAGMSANRVCPSGAGLLMLGHREIILKEHNCFSLTYTEKNEKGGDVFTLNGANIYDFYFAVLERILSYDICAIDQKNIKNAILEALTNCVTNADYYGVQGIEIVKTPYKISFLNPGSFRIGIDEAKKGGASSPRNSALVKLFAAIGIGAGAGSGIPRIFAAFKKEDFPAPKFIESFAPDTITLELYTCKKSKKKSREGGISSVQAALYKDAVIFYLTRNISAGCDEIAALLGISEKRARELLFKMTFEGIIYIDGEKYKLAYK